MRQFILSSSALLILAASALAVDPSVPPPWRGEWSTTSQVWEFNDSVTTMPGVEIWPDGPAPNGMPVLPSTHLIWQPGPPPWDRWLEFDEGAMGVIPLSGRIDVIVDNHDPWKPEKYMWIQLTWRPQDQGEEPIFLDIDPQPVRPPVIVDEIPLGDPLDPLGWRLTAYRWELDWNPPDELFAIEGTINVDRLVVDTWCIPEPATVGLLAVGGLLTLVRRRRK